MLVHSLSRRSQHAGQLCRTWGLIPATEPDLRVRIFGHAKASSVSILNWVSHQQARLQQGDDGRYHTKLSAD